MHSTDGTNNRYIAESIIDSSLSWTRLLLATRERPILEGFQLPSTRSEPMFGSALRGKISPLMGWNCKPLETIRVGP